MTERELLKSKGRRQEAILAELRASPAIRVVELAVAHAVSTETIRRDLDELSAVGLINRTYGGAIGMANAVEPLLDDRYRVNPEQRSAIARAVIPLIRAGDSLMIDAGATTIFVARRLAAEFNDLTVVTNSFGVASALSVNPTNKIRICPGEYDPRDGGVTGPDTLDYLKRFRVAHAILGASRLDAEGPSDFNPSSVSIKRAMLKQADESIFVLSGEKLASAAFERVCGLDEVKHLVTDRLPPEALATALARSKVSVHIPLPASDGTP